jgi:phosphopantothenoylcysteine decarboxylase/phosphopantothenate--cysteine ligase
VGDLASGDTGPGRLVTPELIVKRTHALDKPDLNLKGKKILITMGGTSEELDAVRVLTNKSSGKLGDTLAKTAFFYGADVSVISTMPILNPGYRSIDITKSVDEMHSALLERIDNCDVLYMAAAISDFKPKEVSSQKIRRQDSLSIELEATADLLCDIKGKKKDKTYVGFCLASQDLETTAKDKLKKKGVDYIVANLPQVFGQDTRSVSIYSANNTVDIKEKPIDEIAYELLKLAQ